MAVSTVVLAVVTAWYVRLTSRLARASEATAREARRAAEAASRTAEAAVASIDVDFTVVGTHYPDEGLVVFAVRCIGATVWLYGLSCPVPPPGASLGAVDEGEWPVAELPVYGPATLPSRLHRNEQRRFAWHDAHPEAGGLMAHRRRLVARVGYAIGTDERPTERDVVVQMSATTFTKSRDIRFASPGGGAPVDGTDGS